MIPSREDTKVEAYSEAMMLKVVCAWCGKHQKGSEAAAEVSHTICDECQARAVADFPGHRQTGANINWLDFGAEE